MAELDNAPVQQNEKCEKKNFEMKTIQIVGFDNKLSMFGAERSKTAANIIINNNNNLNNMDNNNRYISGPPCEALTRFNRCYRLQDKIGSGGFGSVYSAIRLTDDSVVAVKHLRKNRIVNFTGGNSPFGNPAPFSRGSLFAGRQPTEIALHARCSHLGGVASLLDYYETIDSFLLVLERPPSSQDLFDFLSERGRLNEHSARKIFHQVVDTIVEMWKLGVVHRDIKDENLLVNTHSLETKLIDFGSAALVKDSPYVQLQGTRVYNPPEWLTSKKYTAEGSTVWSLGILLYDMITSDVPFEQDNEIIAAELSFPDNIQISTECEDLIRRCLRVDQSQRIKLDDITRHPWVTGDVPDNHSRNTHTHKDTDNQRSTETDNHKESDKEGNTEIHSNTKNDILSNTNNDTNRDTVEKPRDMSIDSYTDTRAYKDRDSQSDRDSYTGIERDIQAYKDRNSQSDRDSYTGIERDIQVFKDRDSQSDRDSYTGTERDIQAFKDRDSQSDRDSYTGTESDIQAYPNSQSDINTDTSSDTEAYKDTTKNSDRQIDSSTKSDIKADKDTYL